MIKEVKRLDRTALIPEQKEAGRNDRSVEVRKRMPKGRNPNFAMSKWNQQVRNQT